MNERNLTPQFGDSIRKSFGVPDIRSEFVEEVYGDLMKRVAAKSQRSHPFFILRPAWIVALAILSLMIIGTLVIGPQRVYAAIQSLFGYVPGIGFISTENAFALREPIERTKNGQSFRLTQFVSTSKETFLVLRVENFPAYEDIGLDRRLTVKLSDGSVLVPHSFAVDSTGTPGEYIGVFQFNPLPVGTRKVTVIWKQLINVKNSKILTWRIPVSMFPISDSEVKKILPSSYDPEAAISTDNDITLAVDQVSTTQIDTAIRLQMIFPEVYDYTSPSNYALTDDQGRIYQRKITQVLFEDQGQSPKILTTPGFTQQAFTNLHKTLVFFAVEPTVKQFMLQVDQLDFRASPYLTFSVDMGSHPTVGDSWPINQTMTIGETSFQVNRARVVAIDKDAPGSIGQPMIGLVLDIEPVNPDEVQLNQIWLWVGGSQEVFDGATQTWASAWSVKNVPTGVIEIHLVAVQGILFGKWKIEWKHQEP